MRKVLAALFLMTAPLACPSYGPINSAEHYPDTEWCAVGCFTLQHLTGRDGGLGCEESRSIHGPNGEMITCAENCRQTQDRGENLYPSCWAKVKTCGELEEIRKRSFSCEGH